MKMESPFRETFAGLFIFAVSTCLVAPLYAQDQSTSIFQSQSAGGATSALAPKEMEFERARVQMAEKRFDAAIQTYQNLLKDDPKNASYMNMIGIAYLDLNKYDFAKKYFIRASKTDKKNTNAVNNLGMVYYHQRDFRRAIREYQRAISIDPQQAGPHANLGFAYYNTNKFLEAAVEFQKAIEIEPLIFERNDRVGTSVQDRSVSNHGLFFFTMARVYAQKKDAPHCAEYLRKSLDEGYKDVGKVATDPSFKDVVDDPLVQAVLLRAAKPEQNPSTQPGA
ncbi:MAG TPA: tetratricopeptide repeat protein [Candidatus Acidoferrales bacterium]|jgi:tetratricopeptide (TPR) repeat protein|nr:tetratricopeptide repeat protein [Candidatus Acidoferrales bacterium]